MYRRTNLERGRVACKYRVFWRHFIDGWKQRSLQLNLLRDGLNNKIRRWHRLYKILLIIVDILWSWFEPSQHQCLSSENSVIKYMCEFSNKCISNCYELKIRNTTMSWTKHMIPTVNFNNMNEEIKGICTSNFLYFLIITRQIDKQTRALSTYCCCSLGSLKIFLATRVSDVLILAT